MGVLKEREENVVRSWMKGDPFRQRLIA